MRFAFAGTPLFASWVLRELIEVGRAPSLVVSQLDKPRGRGKTDKAPVAVREAACHGLECLQVDDINSPAVLSRLVELNIDTLVVAAFGQILRRPLLQAVDCLNIHASLLPRYRGAAPIERAIMAGEAVTGVSIMRITEGLDEGPWAEKMELAIGPRQDAGSLSRLLAVVGARALVDVMDGMQDGTIKWTEQQGEASYAAKLSPADTWLDYEATAEEAHDQVRALSPAVGAKGILGTSEVKIWRTWPYGGPGLDPIPEEASGVANSPGAIAAADGRLFIGCARGAVEVLEIQPASRARMRVAAFLRGYSERVTGSMSMPPAQV